MAYTTIKKPSDYFNTKLYAGNGTDDHAITGVDFQPDLTWLKTRASGSHYWFDNVRGATKFIKSDGTDAESTVSSTLKSFDTDGFTLGTSGAVNSGTENFASWNWLGSNTTASNTDGSITSTVSANTTSGFSIVSYTGTGANATVGHGLGSAPKMVITKSRDTTGLDWRTYHASLGATQFVVLNLTDASSTASNFMNNTEPTSSVFSLGSGTTPNKSGDAYIAYCFAEKQGFSKFGSWTGADGAFIYTGFKPAFILGKNATNSAGYDWWTFDNKRDSFNDGANNLLLRPNAADAEQTITFAPIDFLSNGFKIYGTDNTVNGSGETMIYMAFAEEPLVGDNPATAR